ncbi:MAG: glutamine--fructose-6-phosphate transaminase (isomerizing) [Hydrogenophilales bacterium CG03_land_8_20_14_0_80_62_28]|nr:glutamine--fructose-6-phosphate transaminase (isomerizing) [Betaproteobacteria bacterium]OIO77042.1 MAG: glutamine--fructose-6-phosphate aminotransferase [Hydrogenophilaceae bacterium CG1_02_62_390]PIV22627.1 MAG: glutamine--fructose-6-phosphate transaminase (isomerizing) [Hydrogenophilales bacterium CG03_land_8_20_14_0_80_62_28]PIY98923.1 MAG: glutamine--fructose-6-phosphate transaminase (isomerizing) [Hydrogenophilales bacterium CG_4_10_14_0_8_um_filter_62_70]
MCGIVGAIAQRNIVPIIVEGLKRLEYRGYDSAGAAVLHDGRLERVRRVGRVAEMENQVASQGLQGNLGIGHTRWATHGGVTEGNAHPLISRNRVAVVHNGIIENHEAQRARLTSLGYVFESQTDTEVIAHLIDYHLTQSGDLFEATRHAVAELQGAYAIGVVAVDSPDYICCARMGCPLLIGLGEGENYFASDVSALLSQTRRVIYLDDGDVAAVSRNGVHIVDRNGSAVERPERLSAVSADAIELGPYDHYMQKEIHEQPRALANTLEGVVDGGINARLFGAEAEAVFQGIDSILILAAGTSYYASLVGKQWLEAIARIPCNVELGHEYRYRDSIPNPRQLVVTVSQSGETLDTMEALKRAQALGHEQTLSICNVQESALPRASKLVFYTRAGTEIGVASTKAFTTQLCALFILALTLAKQRGQLTPEAERRHLESLRQLPGSVQHALNLEPQIMLWADQFADKEHALFLGRGLHYPIALEGALKLKEISYIHAEAYPAGELKHGPLALVDSHMPVVVIAPNDALLEKVKSNMQEVRARGGQLYVFADQDSRFGETEGVHVIRTPRYAGLLSPVVHAIPVQLLAYHTALRKGTDVDKPRNLAKSVTVE